jgi:hypothetical protein
MRKQRSIFAIALIAGICLGSFGDAEAVLTLRDNVRFNGNLAITGALSKAAGSFVIDHPLDPENKLLYHSFVESPDAKNIYDGVATLDQNGEAVIELPRYFMALNTDFRYHYLPLHKPMPGLYVKDEIRDNRFTIAGGVPHGRISWQVSGNRHDPYIKANPIHTEVEKKGNAEYPQGTYLFEGYAPQ